MRELRRPGRRGLAVALACVSAGLLLSACADMGPRASRVATARACADVTFPVYFEKGSDQLTAPARQELAYAASQVKGCKLGEVEVLGLADADGPEARNLELSKRRAAVV